MTLPTRPNDSFDLAYQHIHTPDISQEVSLSTRLASTVAHARQLQLDAEARMIARDTAIINKEVRDGVVTATALSLQVSMFPKNRKPLTLPQLPLQSCRQYVNVQEENYLWTNAVPLSVEVHPRQYSALVLASNSERIIKNFWKSVELPTCFDDATLAISEHWIWTGGLSTTARTPTFTCRAYIDGAPTLYTFTGVDVAFTLYTGRKTPFGLRQACTLARCINPFHMSPHVNLHTFKLRPGRKPKGWVNPNLPRNDRHAKATKLWDGRTREGRARLALAQRLAREQGISIEEAKEQASVMVQDNLGRWTTP